MKIVINRCYGGFSLSHEGILAYAKRKGLKLWWQEDYEKVQVGEYGRAQLSGGPFCVHYVTANPPTDDDYFSERDLDRDDPDLITVVKKLGERANGSCAKLEIIEIPDGVKYEIEEYDGIEWVAEKHRTWR